MVQEYGRYFGMPTCCLRGGCLTGPNHRGVELHGFLSYLVKCNLEGREYTVFGYKGKQVRDNIHSLDVARFMAAFVAAPRARRGLQPRRRQGRTPARSSRRSRSPRRSPGRRRCYTYVEQNRAGDHICYYRDLRKMRAHYPGVGHHEVADADDARDRRGLADDARRMAEAAMPRLLYLADVPVEASQHGSALMFRALETYPADRLRIVETAVASRPARRLPGVAYASLPIGRRRWLDSRLHGIYSAWLTLARVRTALIASCRRCPGFDVEAVATVGHGFGWVTAAEVARRLHVPLHLIVHDDWPRSSAIVEACRPWLERTFGRVYRGAASRLCVSPFMAEEYERRYGAAGSLMYPSRAKDCPVFPAKAARPIGDGEMVIGYGGNSSPLLVESLRALAAALPGTRTRLALFGGFDEDAKRQLLACRRRSRSTALCRSTR